MEYFDYCESVLEKTPCVEQAIKTGNKAFRQYLEKVNRNKNEYISRFVEDTKFEKALPEIGYYLDRSFGQMEEITYGTYNE